MGKYSIVINPRKENFEWGYMEAYQINYNTYPSVIYETHINNHLRDCMYDPDKEKNFNDLMKDVYTKLHFYVGTNSQEYEFLKDIENFARDYELEMGNPTKVGKYFTRILLDEMEKNNMIKIVEDVGDTMNSTIRVSVDFGDIQFDFSFHKYDDFDIMGGVVDKLNEHVATKNPDLRKQVISHISDIQMKEAEKNSLDNLVKQAETAKSNINKSDKSFNKGDLEK